MRTFVIPDLHGRFDLLCEALTWIEHDQCEKGTVVFLGDYIDRGPQSKEVLERVLKGPKNPKKWTWVKLLGNHEIMALNALAGVDRMMWLNNGGWETLASFGEAAELLSVTSVADSPLAKLLMKLAQEGRLLYADKHRVYVHASIDPQYELNDQSQQVLVWGRYDNHEDEGWRHLHLVHGHTPLPRPLLLKNRSDLDTGAVWTGCLTVGVFEDDMPGGPSFLATFKAA